MTDSLTYSLSSIYNRFAMVADTLSSSADSVSTDLVANGFSGEMVDMPRVVNAFFSDWNLVIILSVAILLVINKQLFFTHFQQLLSSLFSNKSFGQMNREWTPGRSFLGLSGYLSALFTFSLFAQKFFVLKTNNFDCYNSFGFYRQLCLFFAIFFLAKHLIINFMGWLFRTKEASLHFSNLHISLLTVSSVVMLPLILIVLFNPYMTVVVVCALILIVLWLIYVYRSFVEIVLFSKINSFYIFLYFCTLEIIPYWVIVELVVRMIGTSTI